MTRTYTIKDGNNVKLFEIVVTVPDSKAASLSDYQWDSKTGLVTAFDTSIHKRVPLEYTGNGHGAIPPGKYTTTGISAMEHYYWYY